MPPPNLLFHGVSKRTRGSWFARQKDAVDQARAGNLLTGDASAGLLASFDKRPVEPGSEWIAVRALHPKQERLHNEQLSRALVMKHSFSSAEVALFDLPVLHQNTFIVADDGAKYKPLLTTPMSNFVLFDSIDDYVEEIVEQPDSQRFFYEIVAQRCCLYFDLECEDPPDGAGRCPRRAIFCLRLCETCTRPCRNFLRLCRAPSRSSRFSWPSRAARKETARRRRRSTSCASLFTLRATHRTTSWSSLSGPSSTTSRTAASTWTLQCTRGSGTTACS